MILKRNTGESDVLEMGSFESVQMGLDYQNEEKLIYMFSEGLYKFPENSIIRECVSNAIDATVESGRDPLEYPVTVGLDYKKVWIKDRGIGISVERMNNVISKFGGSTKENLADQIGCYGLGFKAPWAYTFQFTVESVFDGVKRRWLFSKDNGIKNITLVHEENTEEETGTTIIVPIKEDYYNWKNIIMQTVPYFRGVVLESSYGWFGFYNQDKLVEGKHFFYKENCPIRTFHIVVDQVVYEINSSDLGFPSSFLPFGVRLSLLDGISPIPSRESLILDNHAKQLIKDRVKLALEEIKGLIISEKLDLYKHLKLNRYSYDIQIADLSLVIDRSVFDTWCKKLEVDVPKHNFTPVDPCFNDVISNTRDIVLLNFILKNYEEIGRLKNGTWTKTTAGTLHLAFEKTVFVCDTILNNTKIEFLKTKFSYVQLVKFERHNKLFKPSKGRDSYYGSSGLSLFSVLRKNWRNYIKAYQAEEDIILESIPKLSTLNAEYEEWLKNRPKKVKIKTIKQDDEITIKIPRSLGSYSNTFQCKFEPQYCKLSQLKRGLYIFSFKREEVDKLWKLYCTRSTIIPVLLNKTDIKKVEKLPNFMKYEDFAKGKSKLAHKYVTALMIRRDIYNSNYLDNVISLGYSSVKQHNLPFLNKTIVKNKVSDIVDFLNKWKGQNNETDAFYESLFGTYTKLGLIDKPVWEEWQSLKKDLESLYFLPYLKDTKDIDKIKKSIYVMQRQNKFLKRKLKI